MIRSLGVLDLPRRITLSAQAAAALRRAIAGNLWREFLPSERRLCDLLQVSRPTVRTALHTLAEEGLIEICHGRRIRLRPQRRTATAPQSRLVALVSHQPIARLTLTAYQGISEMRAQLAKHGFITEEFVCLGRTATTQRRKLEAFLRQNRVFCCLLISVSREVQEWFAAHAIPALVLGSCPDAVKLPSLDVDYRAVCRHAAGTFLRAGHRRLAFLVPDLGIAGDLASEEGFCAGVAARPGLAGASATVIRHNGTAVDLGAKLAGLLRAPQPPTALLVARPVHTITVLVHLLRKGIRVPETISVLARDHDAVYANALSHYAFETGAFAHRLSRLMLKMVGRGHLPAEPSLIFPRYVSQDTVRSPRSAGA